MRILRAFGALSVLLVVLVAVPILLWVLGSIPPVHHWAQALRAPDDGSVLIGLMTVIGWLAWTVVAVAIVLEAIALLSKQRLRIRLPGLAWLHSGVGALMVSVLGPVAPALAASPEPPPVTFVAADDLAETVARPTSSLVTPAHEEQHTESSSSAVTHRVQLGDDLWSLAEHYYGDGSQWRQIAAANPDKLSGGPDVLQPGWELRIPNTEVVLDAPSIQVAEGDTLSSLSAQHLGDETRWPELWHTNRAVLADPDVLPVGLILRLPATPTGVADEPDSASAPSSSDTTAADDSATPGGEPSSSTPTPTPSETSPDTATDLQATAFLADESSDAGLLLAGVGGLLAAGLVGSFAARRLIQLHERPLGQRLAQPQASTQRLATALQIVQHPTGRETLTTARRLVAQHCQETGGELPILRYIRLGDDCTELVFAEAVPPAAGFAGEPGRWVLVASEASTTAVLPDPWPALITVGRQADGSEVLIDLEAEGQLGIDLGDVNSEQAAARALIAELLTRPTAPSVIVVGIGQELIEAAAASHVRWDDDIDSVLRELTARSAQHHRDAATGTARSVRHDINREEAWQPTIVIVGTDLTAAQRRTLNHLVADSRSPVVAVRLGVPCSTQLVGDAHSALLEPAELTISPAALSPTVEASVTELFVTTGTAVTTPAPWWSGHTSHKSHPVNVSRIGPNQESSVAQSRSVVPSANPPATAPLVRILGPIELENAAGTVPPRAVKQCIEYCAWLLANPGRTSREMAEQLFVAETTRRSNMSRLRTWLGTDPAGEPYLPEAYSGRIHLSEAVTSDWLLLGQVLPGDIQTASDDALKSALELVRGAPLADAAPQQWGWAETLRLDLISLIRDAAVVLAERAAESRDLELVRWATAQGLAAAPEDELLQAVRLRAEHRAGNHSEVDRISRRILVRARTLDLDLLDDTVDLLQEITEGQIRARRAL